WPACDRFRSPHGFAQLSEHVTRIIAEPDAARQKEMVRSEDSFNLWQSILRGAGVITGCRRCADVCPVGADYAAMLSDALEAIPENTPEKEARAAAMNAEEKAGHLPETYAEHRRWIGDLPPPGCWGPAAPRRPAEGAPPDRAHPIRRQKVRACPGAPRALLRRQA